MIYNNIILWILNNKGIAALICMEINFVIFGIIMILTENSNENGIYISKVLLIISIIVLIIDIMILISTIYEYFY